MANGHVLVVTYPGQGHINPSLQFAKRLTRAGIQVTFVTTVFAVRRMAKASGTTPEGLSFAPFSDGYDDGFNGKEIDGKAYMSGMEREGSNTLRNVIISSADKGCPVTCLVYSPWFPWAATVARENHIPSAVLWIQPATVFAIYYHYFHGYGDDVKNVDIKDSTWSIQFPGVPLLKSRDLPSFLLPSSDPINDAVLQTFKRLIDVLDNEEKPNVLMNTFDDFEPQALKAITNYNVIPTGPLTPSAFLNGKDTSDTSFGGDLFQKSNDYQEWLNCQDAASVIYVSFGSLLTLPRQQMEEIGRGLLKTGRPFLWVMRTNEGQDEKEEEKLSCMEELEQKGMIVPWCSQLEVLTHPSLGCFVTHCGWNSTLESILSGVPVVAFPVWTDQGTNAKLIEDVWRTGVRVTPNEEGTIERDEIARCIEIVMDNGDQGSEWRNNAKKWKELTREALQDGGSSHKNLMAFLEGLV